MLVKMASKRALLAHKDLKLRIYAGNYGIVFYKWVLTIGKNREESIENPDLVYYTYISNIE